MRLKMDSRLVNIAYLTQRIANLGKKLSSAVLHSLENFIVDGSRKHQSSKSGASLSLSSESSEDDALDDRIGVSEVGSNDQSVVAAKFEDALAESSLNFDADFSADSGRAGEGDERNSLVRSDGLSNVGAAGDEGADSWVVAVSLEDLGADVLDSDGGQSRGWRGLPDHGVSGIHG